MRQENEDFQLREIYRTKKTKQTNKKKQNKTKKQSDGMEYLYTFTSVCIFAYIVLYKLY